MGLGLKFKKTVITNLPWKKTPHFLESLSKIYEKIEPVHLVDGSSYHIWKNADAECWFIKFEDAFAGNDYVFGWDGQGLNEINFKQLA